MTDAFSGNTLFSAVTLLSAQVCPLCRTPVSYGGICENCFLRLEKARKKKTSFEIATAQSVVSAYAVYRYDNETVKSLLFYLKNRRDRAAVNFAAMMMSGVLADADLPEGTVFINVPRSAKGLRLHGFDQAALLASRLCVLQENGSAYIPCVKRHGIGKEQKALDAQARRENLRDKGYLTRLGAYRVQKARAFVIVDDVTTTGESVRLCADALQKAFPHIPVSACLLAANRLSD